LLLVSENFHIGDLCGFIDGDVDPVVGEDCATALLPVPCDAVPHLAEPGEFFDVGVNQVAWYLAFITLHYRLALQVSQPPHATPAQGPGHGGDADTHQPGDMTQVQALVA